MYQYWISEGKYEDFGDCNLFHSKEFSKEEFKEILFKSICKLKEREDSIWLSELADELKKNYGFFDFKVTQRIHIHDFGIEYVELLEDLK